MRNSTHVTSYERYVAKATAPTDNVVNGRRQTLRHERGMISAWEAICGLRTGTGEVVMSIEEWRYMMRGSGQVIG